MQPVAPQPFTEAPSTQGPDRWQLRLLGAVEARRNGLTVSRWPSRAAALLLARLALAPQQVHPREALVELLWPGVSLDVGRNRLRQTLSTLKSLLESGPSNGPVIDADRQSLRLVPGSLQSDAVEFEHLVRTGDWAAARARYGGDLLPGHYDDWVLEARAHLTTLFERVDARSVPEPVVARPLPPDDLPASWTRVFGIEHRATRLLALLQQERLVTVVGAGGCGKTRLTLEAARALRDGPAWSMPPEGARTPMPRFARIVFVPLAECTDAAQATAALARALHLQGADTMQQVRSLLAGAPVLLVLDNFEQLVASARRLPLQLLEAVPTLHLVVTSRLRLDLPGEQVFSLGGLPLPDADADVHVDSASLNPGVALFVDRARAVRPDFHLGPSDLAPVCGLVRWLDGMPLALELAASRIGSFAPAQLLRLLAGDDPLRLLSRSAPRAGHDARQASMEQVIDWSWQLLTAPEQAALAALSGFAGDAGLPGLVAVLGEPAAVVAARLDDLAGHSLLRALAPRQDGAPRFMLSEPVREFVISRWPASRRGDLQRAIHDWLLHWARTLHPNDEVTAVEAELRCVLSMLLRQPSGPQGAVELALALRPYWEAAGMPASQQTALEQALHTEGQALWPDGLACDAHELLAYVRFEAGFTAEARTHADAALALAGNSSARRARALVRRVWVELATGHGLADPGPQTARLQALLDEALALGRDVADADVQARALHQLAVMRSNLLGDWTGAEVQLAEAERLWLTLGNQRKAQARRRNRAQCWVRLGHIAEAKACFERCVSAAQEQGNWVEQIDSLISLSSLLIGQRQWQGALDLSRQCVQLCWQRWHRHGLGYALWNAPLALARLRRPESALRLMAFAARFWESNFGPLAPVDQQTIRRVRRLSRAQVGEARAQAAWDEGAAMDIAHAVALALHDRELVKT